MSDPVPRGDYTRSANSDRAEEGRLEPDPRRALEEDR